ncbi:MAG TPA: O-antigen ligase family protein, partial [Armatimonadota bacterium]
ELSRPWVLPTAAAAIFQFSALMLTGSRGGWLSLSVGLAVMVVVGVRRLKEGSGPRLLVIAGILVALTPALALPTARRVATSSEGEQASSMAFRRLTWRGTLDQALAHPLLGTGYGTFEISYPQYARAGYTKLAHNSYLQLAAETGFPGMLLMLAAIGAGLWACLSPNVLRKWGWPVAGLAGGITAFALHNCFESTLYVPPCAWTFLALLGASTQPMPAGTGARAKEMLWSGLALAGAVLALLGAPAGVGQSSAAEAQTLRERGDLNGSLVSLDEALRWDPRNPKWRIQRAETLLLTGRKDAGLTQFAQLAESEPHRAQVYHRWGLALQALGDPRRARDRYHQAVALEPNRTESLLKLAQVDELLGDVPAARRCYDALVALERGPVGRVRALAGYVNLDYAEAYLALARLSTGPADLGKRREMAREAAHIASEFLRDMVTWKATLQSVGQWRPERESRAKVIVVESLRLGDGGG